MSDTNLIITGKTGEAHISSSDDGSLFGGIFGEEDYILSRGTKLQATLSGQIVTVGAGDLIMQGRHARIQSSEVVTIQSPTNGTARYTDVCFQYRKDLEDNSNEFIKLIGINGNETSQSENPPAPLLTKGNIFNEDVRRDVRLCRVLYDTRGGVTSITLITDGVNEFTYLDTAYSTAQELPQVQEDVETLQEDVAKIYEDMQTYSEEVTEEFTNLQKVKVCTLASANWTAEGSFYKQTVNLQHVYDAHPTWNMSNNAGTGISASLEAMFVIAAVVTNLTITFYAYNQPTVDLYAAVKGVD